MGMVRRPAVVVAAVALLTVASLGLLAWDRFAASPETVPGSTASLGGLTTEVRQVAWVDFDMGHVMDGEGGFMMPDQMMPGAPGDGEARLGVDVTFTNTDSRGHGFNVADEFSVTGRAPSADTIGDLPGLGPGAAVDGTLYFDIPVPDDDAPIFLEWERGGDTVRVEVSPATGDGVPDVHEH